MLPPTQESLASIAGRKLLFISGQATASGDTQLLPVVAGKEYHIRTVMFNNAGSADITAYISCTIGGSVVERVPVLLKPGAIFSRKFAPDYVEVDKGTAVNINLSASGNVNYDMDYEIDG